MSVFALRVWAGGGNELEGVLIHTSIFAATLLTAYEFLDGEELYRHYQHHHGSDIR